MSFLHFGDFYSVLFAHPPDHTVSVDTQPLDLFSTAQILYRTRGPSRSNPHVEVGEMATTP